MVVISEKELKKRAEHNYGRLHDLEEVKYVTYVDFELFANDQILLQLLHFSKMFSQYNLDKLLQTSVQISLHQLHIQKIENLDKLCRGLKIVYLQVIIKEEHCFRSVILIAFVILERGGLKV